MSGPGPHSCADRTFPTEPSPDPVHTVLDLTMDSVDMSGYLSDESDDLDIFESTAPCAPRLVEERSLSAVERLEENFLAERAQNGMCICVSRGGLLTKLLRS